VIGTVNQVFDCLGYIVDGAVRTFYITNRVKAYYIAKASRQPGIISHFTHPLVIGLRNFALRYLTPESVNLKQMDKLFGLTIPG
jgi:hypothetical protein